MNYYAYLLCKPDTTPFYIGKGTYDRTNYLKSRNPYCQNIIDKYGAENILIGRLECSTEQIALNLEEGIIKCFKRMGIQLTNQTEGGEGISGYKHTEESKQKMRESMRGENNPMYGKKFSEKTKQKMSESRQGKKAHQAKFVKETNLSLIFGCIRDAAKHFNVNHHDIGWCCEVNIGKEIPSNRKIALKRIKEKNLNFVYVEKDKV